MRGLQITRVIESNDRAEGKKAKVCTLIRFVYSLKGMKTRLIPTHYSAKEPAEFVYPCSLLKDKRRAYFVKKTTVDYIIFEFLLNI